jgi:hypothetical protein
MGKRQNITTQQQSDAMRNFHRWGRLNVFFGGSKMSPCDYKTYPDNWRWLSKQIIESAGNRCELCYAPNGSYVIRDKTNSHPWRYRSIHDGGIKDVKIVLTVHHIDGDHYNSKKQNLIPLCQRCHLRLDLQKHMKNRTRDKREGGLPL